MTLCARVCRTWFTAANQYRGFISWQNRNPVDLLDENLLRLGNETVGACSMWELCNTIFQNRRSNLLVEERTPMFEDRWPVRTLDLVCDTLLHHECGPIRSLSICIHGNSFRVVSCDFIVKNVIRILSRGFHALTLRLTKDLITAPTFNHLVHELIAHPVPCLSLTVATTNDTPFLIPWAHLLQHYLCHGVELAIVCPDVFTSMAVCEALAEAHVASHGCPTLRRLSFHLCDKGIFMRPLLFSLWSILETMRSVCVCLREVELGLENLIGACVVRDLWTSRQPATTLDWLRFHLNGSSMSAPLLAHTIRRLFAFLGPCHNAEIRLGENPFLDDLWTGLLPVVGEWCYDPASFYGDGFSPQQRIRVPITLRCTSVARGPQMGRCPTSFKNVRSAVSPLRLYVTRETITKWLGGRMNDCRNCLELCIGRC